MTDLDYEDFKKYEVTPESIGFGQLDGINHKFVFPNGYGASVIKSKYSYGHEEDLFELAVLKKTKGNDYDLFYDSGVIDNVIGWLNNKEVLEYLDKIKNLKEE